MDQGESARIACGFIKKVCHEVKMYCLIRGNSAFDIEQKVNEKMTEGWQPIGGIAVAYDPDHNPRSIGMEKLHYFQAMIDMSESGRV